MATFSGYLSKARFDICPTPGHLGVLILENCGCILACVDDPESKETENVAIYGGQTLMGWVTYHEDPNHEDPEGVLVTVVDAPGSTEMTGEAGRLFSIPE